MKGVRMKNRRSGRLLLWIRAWGLGLAVQSEPSFLAKFMNNLLLSY